MSTATNLFSKRIHFCHAHLEYIWDEKKLFWVLSQQEIEDGFEAFLSFFESNEVLKYSKWKEVFMMQVLESLRYKNFGKKNT